MPTTLDQVGERQWDVPFVARSIEFYGLQIDGEDPQYQLASRHAMVVDGTLTIETNPNEVDPWIVDGSILGEVFLTDELGNQLTDELSNKLRAFTT